MSNPKPLISVIVPVYKVEKYLNRCIDSIICQTYDNLEIILVDDGSPDRCGEICDEYAEQDSRIKVIHQENGGLSAARNVGLDICKGDYIAFVDSDDYIRPDMYEQMSTVLIEQQVDICVCQWEYENIAGQQVVDLKKVNSDIYGRMSSHTFARFLFKGAYENGVVVAAWNKLYKKRLFQEIRFSGKYQEDDALHTVLLSQNFEVYVLDKQFYIYTENPSSLTNQKFRDDSLRILDIMAERTKCFSNDLFIVWESKRAYCNLYIEYYYKALEAGITMPNRRLFYRYVYDLWKSRSCNFKFVIRMMLFLVSPKIYHVLLG